MNPLDQLRDIHPPPPPGFWPLAPGWWVLAAATLLATAAVALWLIRRHRDNRYRRTALTALSRTTAARGDLPLPDLLALIRRTARAANPASDWAALSAAALLQRLDRATGGRFGAELAGAGSGLDDLAESQYRPADATDPRHAAILQRWTLWWLRHHRRRDLC